MQQFASLTLLAAALLGCEATPPSTNTAPASAPGAPHQYRSAYQGLAFAYPAAWKNVATEHAAANLQGPRDCSVYISAMVPNGPETPQHALAFDRLSAQTDHPGTKLTDRPAWAGPQRPTGGFLFAIPEKRLVEIDTIFDQDSVPLSLTETMREGDESCANDLRFFESSLRITRPQR